MIAEGRIKYEDLPKPFFKSIPLKKDFIAKGDVYITPIAYNKGRFSVSLLFLAPGSSVKKHKCKDSCVRYQILGSQENKYCLIGKKNKLVNLSKSFWLVVIVAKRYYVCT